MTTATEATKATSSGTTPAPAGTEEKGQVNGDPLGPTGGGDPGGPVGQPGGAHDPTQPVLDAAQSVSGTDWAADVQATAELQDAGFEEKIAEICHEANRSYCAMNGDHSQVAWKDAPEWQRSSAIMGVRAAQTGNTPRQSHEGWMAQKLADGWKFGAEKNPEAKTHPCLVEYDKLTEEQKAKDLIFVSIVRALTSMRDST